MFALENSVKTRVVAISFGGNELLHQQWFLVQEFAGVVQCGVVN